MNHASCWCERHRRRISSHLQALIPLYSPTLFCGISVTSSGTVPERNVTYDHMRVACTRIGGLMRLEKSRDGVLLVTVPFCQIERVDNMQAMVCLDPIFLLQLAKFSPRCAPVNGALDEIIYWHRRGSCSCDRSDRRTHSSTRLSIAGSV